MADKFNDTLSNTRVRGTKNLTPEKQQSSIDEKLEILARYHALVDAFEGFIYICSPEFRIEYMNQRLIERTGFDGTGGQCYEALHNRNSVCPWCVNDRVFAGETVRWEVQSPMDSRWYSVVNIPLHHPDGRISKYSMIVDITERKQVMTELETHRDRLEELVNERTAELELAKQALETELTERREVAQALRESEERYRQLVETANVGIVVTQGGKLRFLNPWVSEVSGYDADQLHKNPFLNYIHPDDREMVMAHHLRRLKGEEKPEPYVMRFIDSSNRIRYLENKGRIIKWNGEPATLNFLSDITEQIQAEQQIRELSQQLLLAQENERMRISRDLHDSVAQDLSSLHIGMQSLVEILPKRSEKAREGLDEMVDEIKRIIANVRQIAYGLRPSTLDHLGLVPTVYHYCEEFSKKNNIQVDFYSAGMDNLSLGFETASNIYRVIQEALGNVYKHSSADKVLVRLLSSHPHIICRIRDNGVGFEAEKMTDRGGGRRMGLRSMEERVRLLGGTLQIHSRPGEGTKIEVKIPMME